MPDRLGIEGSNRGESVMGEFGHAARVPFNSTLRGLWRGSVLRVPPQISWRLAPSIPLGGFKLNGTSFTLELLPHYHNYYDVFIP